MINSYRILRAMLRQCLTLTYCNPASPGCVLFCQAVPATRFKILKIFEDLTAQSSKAKLWTTHLWKCWRSLRNKGLSFRKTDMQHLPATRLSCWRPTDVCGLARLFEDLRASELRYRHCGNWQATSPNSANQTPPEKLFVVCSTSNISHILPLRRVRATPLQASGAGCDCFGGTSDQVLVLAPMIQHDDVRLLKKKLYTTTI